MSYFDESNMGDYLFPDLGDDLLYGVEWFCLSDSPPPSDGTVFQFPSLSAQTPSAGESHVADMGNPSTSLPTASLSTTLSNEIYEGSLLGGLERTLDRAQSSVDSYDCSSYQSYQIPSSPSVMEASHDISSEVSRTSVPAIALPSRIDALQEPSRISLPPSYGTPLSKPASPHTVLYPSVLSQNCLSMSSSTSSDHEMGYPRVYISPSSTASRDRLRKKPPKHSNVAVGQRSVTRVESSIPSNQTYFRGDANAFYIPEVEMTHPVRPRVEEPVEFAGMWRGDEETAFWRPVVIMGRKEGVSVSLGSQCESSMNAASHPAESSSPLYPFFRQLSGQLSGQWNSQSSGQLNNQSINQSNNQSLTPTLHQSLHPSITSPTHQPLSQSINHSLTPSPIQSLTQPLNPLTHSMHTATHPSISQQTIHPSLMSQSMNQPSINQPLINQSSINQPSINQPTIHQSSINQPSINQPSINQPTIHQSSINHPSINQSTNQPTINQPSNHPLTRPINSPSLLLRRQIARAHLLLFLTPASFLLLPATSPAIARLRDPQAASQLARRFLPLTSYDTPLFDALQRGVLPREIETVGIEDSSHVGTGRNAPQTVTLDSGNETPGRRWKIRRRSQLDTVVFHRDAERRADLWQRGGRSRSVLETVSKNGFVSGGGCMSIIHVIHV